MRRMVMTADPAMVPTIRTLGLMSTGTIAGITLGTMQGMLGRDMIGGARVRILPLGGMGAQEVQLITDPAASA